MNVAAEAAAQPATISETTFEIHARLCLVCAACLDLIVLQVDEWILCSAPCNQLKPLDFTQIISISLMM